MNDVTTFRTEIQEDGTARYICLICDHWATDAELFTMHMDQRHSRGLVKASEEPEPAPAPEEEPAPEPVPSPPPEEEPEPAEVAS